MKIDLVPANVFILARLATNRCVQVELTYYAGRHEAIVPLDKAELVKARGAHQSLDLAVQEQRLHHFHIEEILAVVPEPVVQRHHTGMNK